MREVGEGERSVSVSEEREMLKETGTSRSRSRSRSKSKPTALAGPERIANPRDIESARQQPKEEEPTPLAVRLLPHPLPHFLGYRRPKHLLSEKQKADEPFPPLLPFVRWLPRQAEALLWAWIGGFVGIAIVEVIFARPSHFSSSKDLPPHPWQSPVIIGSFGASSVLLYATPASPLAQPRAFVGGQTLSALTGVVITKLVALSPHYNINLTDRSNSLVWLAGALSVGSALCVMMMTGTLHPPGGATALLCATNSEVARLGWKVIPVVLLSSVLMLLWALLWMNLGRVRYPQSSFWAPSPPSPHAGNTSQWIIDWVSRKRHPRKAEEEKPARETQKTTMTQSPTDAEKEVQPGKLKGVTEWHDESPWTASNSTHVDRTHDPEAFVEEESEGHDEEGDERTERPSRWETAAVKRL